MPSNTKQKKSDNHDLELKILNPMFLVKVSRQNKEETTIGKKKPEIKEESKERRKQILGSHPIFTILFFF